MLFIAKISGPIPLKRLLLNDATQFVATAYTGRRFHKDATRTPLGSFEFPCCTKWKASKAAALYRDVRAHADASRR